MTQYDNWKLASPPHYDDEAMCECGHAMDDHDVDDCCLLCDCEEAKEADEPADPLDDGDAAYDAWKDERE